jgi:hypothetical protein
MYALAMTVFWAKLPENCYNHVLKPRRMIKRISAANAFFAHLRSPGEEQLLCDHLLNTSTITSRLAAKAGMPRVGALIGLAHTQPDLLCTHPRFT